MDPQDLELRYYPDRVLVARTRPVQTPAEQLPALTRRMFEIMYEHGGIGLAGPQVGWCERIFVLNLSPEADPAGEQVFINPVIVERAGQDSFEEGCLSFPGIRLEIERAVSVKVVTRNLQGQSVELEADDLLARCIQHELDHLDGILFVSRVSVATRMRIRKDLKELRRQYEEGAGAGRK